MSHDTLKNLPKGLLDAARMMIETTKPIQTKTVQSFDEALVGNQHKLDANKNGKIDAHDFKLLRRKKTMKEALDNGVAVEDIVQFNSPMQQDLHEEIGVVVHRDRRDNTIHVVSEGKKYKLTKGQVKEVSEELLGELSKDTMLKYLSANKKSDAKAQDAGDYSKSVKRMRGTDMAVRKYTAKPGSKSVRVPAKEETEITEDSGDAPINQMSHEDLGDYIGKHPDWVKKNRKKAEDAAHEMSESVEQIDEISKETMLSYKRGAEADIASTKKPGKPSKAAAALRVKRGAGLENVKAKLNAIYKQEHQARQASLKKANNEVDSHFEKNHDGIFKKHGFKLMSQGETSEHDVKTYVHPHENGHATIVSIQTKKGHEDSPISFGYKHEVRGVNTKGTSYSSHYPNTGVYEDKPGAVEQHKNEMLPKFESHLIRMKEDGASNNRF